MTERRLATVERVQSVRPVENSDNLNVVTVRGWEVVSNKESGLIEGDRVVYFEIDSMLPVDDPRFAFLAARSTRVRPDGTKVHVLKTAKLRGQVSQGLVVPLEEFPELEWDATAIGQDVTEVLGIEKYEAPLPNGGNLDAVGRFPTHLVSKTDAERVQNLTSVYDYLLETGSWYATEKIDGTSLTVARDWNYDTLVCSRNWQLSEGDNLYWRVVKQFDLNVYLIPGEVVQAEIYGPGVQGNPLKVNEISVAVFGFYYDGEALPRAEWPKKYLDLAAPCYTELTLPDTVAEAVAQVDGIKSLISPGRLAEGVVWHNGEPDKVDPNILGRPCFKAISNRYLLKHDS